MSIERSCVRNEPPNNHLCSWIRFFYLIAKPFKVHGLAVILHQANIGEIYTYRKDHTNMA